MQILLIILFGFFFFIQVSFADWNTKTYQSAYILGYENSTNLYKNQKKYVEDSNLWCSKSYNRNYKQIISEELFMKGCVDGIESFKSGKPLPDFGKQIPTETQQSELRKESQKYCSRNYQAVHLFHEKCCIETLMEKRIELGPLLDTGAVVFQTNFQSCGDLNKIYKYGYDKTYDLLVSGSKLGTEELKEAEKISECSGNALVEKYKQNNARLSNMNKVFREVFKDCRNNPSLYLTDENSENKLQNVSLTQNEIDEALNYCMEDYYLNIYFENSCCAEKLATARKRIDPSMQLYKVLFKADGNTFRGCVSNDTLSKYGTERSEVLIKPYTKGYYKKYSVDQAKVVASCSGDKLVELFKVDPNPKKKRVDNLIREAMGICMTQ